jgi:hypothetical protein
MMPFALLVVVTPLVSLLALFGREAEVRDDGGRGK